MSDPALPSGEAALPNWAYAHGPPVGKGRIRVEPADFRVIEQSRVVPAGHGEHQLLWVRKTGRNTGDVAGALARYAGVPGRDVGYAGRKDRHAVTEQWFSLRLAGRVPPDWSGWDEPGVEILKWDIHDRKLKTGALTGNRFELVIRSWEGQAVELAARLAAVRDAGVPNYFGPQRFGRGCSNLVAARRWFASGRAPRRRDIRSLALSAARAFVFNELLSARVTDGSWCRRIAGEVFALDGSRGVFVDDASAELDERLAAMDIHPSGPLPGTGTGQVTGAAAALEQAVLEGHGELVDGLIQAGVRADRRPLRVALSGMQWGVGQDRIELSFALPAGAFATSVLREIVATG